MFSSSSESDPDEPESSPGIVVATKSRVGTVATSTAIKVKSSKTERCRPCDKLFTEKGMKLHQQRFHKDQDVSKKSDGIDVEEDDVEDDEDGPVAPSRNVKDRKEPPAGRTPSGRERKNPPLKKLFSCVYCQKRFSHLASMKVHEKVHLGGKPHQCDMCAAKFSNKFDLFAHEEKTHSSARPHKCDECAATFKTADSLRFHKLIHEESQPMVCRFCQRGFKNKGQLDFHERVHLGEKPFKCDHCGQGFETATKLTRHITVSHMQE